MEILISFTEKLFDNTNLIWLLTLVLFAIGALFRVGLHIVAGCARRAQLTNLSTAAIVAGTLLLALHDTALYFQAKLVAPAKPLPVPERGTVTVTFRDFLNREDTEVAGLGLYTYLVFSKGDSTNEKQRIAAVRAYLNGFNVAASSKRLLDRRQKNGFYFLTKEDAEWIDECQKAPPGAADAGVTVEKPRPAWICTYGRKTRPWSDEELATWVVRNYDSDRADILFGNLRSVKGGIDRINGIYIISYERPLTSPSVSIDSAKVLIQDLSRLKPEDMEIWVEECSLQFTKAEYWNINVMRRLILTLYTRFPEIADLIEESGQATAKELFEKLRKK